MSACSLGERNMIASVFMLAATECDVGKRSEDALHATATAFIALLTMVE